MHGTQKMEKQTNIQEILSEYFTLSGISPYQFAIQFHIPQSKIYNWLKGISSPSLESCLALCDALNCSLDCLLGLTNSNTLKKTNTPTDFQHRLNELLTQYNYTKYHIAKICGIGQSAVSKWFHQNALPNIRTLICLSECFSCSVDYLLGRFYDILHLLFRQYRVLILCFSSLS